MNFPVNAGRADELLALFEATRAEGVEVTMDTYPYLAGGTTLAALMPGWASAGGPDALLARLADATVRARIARALENGESDGAHLVPVDWSAIEIAGVGRAELAGAVGHSVAEVAAMRGQDPTDVALDLVVADDLATTILMHVGDEANVRTMMRDPGHCGGSDGLFVGDRPHPRGWGTFARYLARYVRELGVLTLPEAVEHLAARPARVVGLTDRGVLREGAVADLVLLDPATVTDRATYADPRQLATGVTGVWLEGRAAWRDGQVVDARAGRALRVV
ncbi:amidohydrolase family protein [Litorihabitans aurantiacus]|uniref:Amidohydrolase 3 domain-containing protein n=1 Tax=Litorihabitans aurantiacus TaxID=1930061 RepID=A0AA37XEY7_9MICO|nr:amidohydrolase family protein [Litorihabitans aurantiacus]GMA32113.1 hypothetical protein GCM10025875_21050 [Litorihabitans aurantiacus]